MILAITPGTDKTSIVGEVCEGAIRGYFDSELAASRSAVHVSSAHVSSAQLEAYILRKLPGLGGNSSHCQMMLAMGDNVINEEVTLLT